MVLLALLPPHPVSTRRNPPPPSLDRHPLFSFAVLAVHMVAICATHPLVIVIFIFYFFFQELERDVLMPLVLC